MTSHERRLSLWLGATGVAYLAGALDFVVRPWAATSSLGALTRERLPAEEPGLYHSLAAAYMATIAALALTASRDPKGRRALVPPLLVAKAASSAALLWRYSRTERKGFALGAAIDASILGVTAGLYGSLDR